MKIGNSNWHISSFDYTKMKILIYLSSLHDFWPPSNLISLVQNSLDEMERREKSAFQLLKLRKKEISWNKNTKLLTQFLLTVGSTSMKDYTSQYVVST